MTATGSALAAVNPAPYPVETTIRDVDEFVAALANEY
jgi:hypothetical protein